MPRPKRAKVAPSAPAPRLREPAVAKKTALAESTAPAEKDDIYDISDPDEVITSVRRVPRSTTKPSRKGKEPAREEEDLDQDEVADAPPQEDNALEGSYDDIDLSSSIEMSRNEPISINTPASRMSLANFRRRPRQPSILGRGPGRARSSSVESNLAQDNLMSVGQNRGRARAGSISRGKGVTPLRSVGSLVNLGNFKRREREPSILGTGNGGE
jgi:hypothetical protein